MRLTLKEKLKIIPEKIEIDKRILNNDIKRGVYGVFSFDERNKIEICYYIGRAVNIRSRFFNYNGHFTNFIWKNKKITIVEKIIKDILSKKLTVKIIVLEEVPYEYDNYYKDMQRLASTECKYIDKYQEKNQALNQLPEGKWLKKEKWEKDKNSRK